MSWTAVLLYFLFGVRKDEERERQVEYNVASDGEKVELTTSVGFGPLREGPSNLNG